MDIYLLRICYFWHIQIISLAQGCLISTQIVCDLLLGTEQSYSREDSDWVYELFVGNQPHGSEQRRGRFTVPTADLSASILAVTALSWPINRRWAR